MPRPDLPPLGQHLHPACKQPGPPAPKDIHPPGLAAPTRSSSARGEGQERGRKQRQETPCCDQEVGARGRARALPKPGRRDCLWHHDSPKRKGTGQGGTGHSSKPVSLSGGFLKQPPFLALPKPVWLGVEQRRELDHASAVQCPGSFQPRQPCNGGFRITRKD